MLLGLRTVIYVVPDLGRAKAWYTEALGKAPYFDQPFYVGFEVGGYELGLVPAEGEQRAGVGGTRAYWGVDDIEAAHRRLIGLGAGERTPIEDVGEGIQVATVLDPFGNVFGLIRNPHFKLG